MSHSINPDIASRTTTVGIVKATKTIVSSGTAHNFAVLERVTFPHVIIENVASHNAYQGAYTVDEALEIIEDTWRYMP